MLVLLDLASFPCPNKKYSPFLFFIRARRTRLSYAVKKCIRVRRTRLSYAVKKCIRARRTRLSYAVKKCTDYPYNFVVKTYSPTLNSQCEHHELVEACGTLVCNLKPFVRTCNTKQSISGGCQLFSFLYFISYQETNS